jgi:hypothetical protein
VAGKSLGRSATAARRALAADPARQIVATSVDLQDWVVPTVYEATPLVLLAPSGRSAPLIHIKQASDEHGGAVEVGMPRAPDVGFFGRDETLLGLDRAFDTHQVVLLHAYAGSGKSTTASEFARWYQATGGLNHPHQPGRDPGPVLWTSFEHHTSLEQVLNTVGDTFADALDARGNPWQALTDPQRRREVVLQVLEQQPVLWVWDNVEPVAGFPASTPSVWSQDEQDELAEFLRDLASRTRCKVVLTSRRDEHVWLGDLATRVELPPMPMRERLQLTAAIIARRAGDTPRDLDWRPLLRYTAGNPLTITVVVGLALREHLATSKEIEGFVARVRSGEVALEGEGDADLGRTRSLAASLDYGFTHAFTDTERAQLAVLHLFRDTVYVGALCFMGNPAQDDGVVPTLAGLNQEAGTSLLDRAVEVGLLTTLGGGHYGIHPALPWYFTIQFALHHGSHDSPSARACARAYIRSIDYIGDYYHREAEAGSAIAVPVLALEEANLLHALDLARHRHLHDDAVGCMQGLQVLYEHTGRAGEWASLVDQVAPDYIDPDTDRPLPGREDQYSIIAGYRVRQASQRRDWPTANRLHQAIISWHRDQAKTDLAKPRNRLDVQGRELILDLAVSLHLLGRTLIDQADPACLPPLQEAFDLSQRIEDGAGEAKIASTIGNAYLLVPGLRDLDKAEHWHQRSLDLTPQHDLLNQSVSLAQLASVANERFLAGQAAGASEAVLGEYLDAAATGYYNALDLTPADNPEHLTVCHHQLGNLYGTVANLYGTSGKFAKALYHFQQAIRYQEVRGDTFGAGQTRYNIAILHAYADRHADALRYAKAALDNFTRVGPGAADQAALAQALISQLKGLTGQPTL